jgi:predicted metal-binding membrane protein
MHVGPYAVAAVLASAGAYQFTRAKRACLRRCRSPLSFLAARWRPGVAGALRVGMEHAGYCLGCCSMLMIVLVAAGAMGLPWVLLIAAAVFVEKIPSWGEQAARILGVALVALGVVIATQPNLLVRLRG